MAGRTWDRGAARQLVRRTRRGYLAGRAEGLSLYSAALAFYGLISVAPLVVVALWVTSLVVGEAKVHEVAADLARVAPPEMGVDRALESVAELGTTLGLLAVAAALWPATAYGAALARVLNRLDGDSSAAGLRGRGVALLLVGLVPVLVIASLVASYVGAAAFGEGIAAELTLAVGAGFVTTFATVAVIYKVFPRVAPDWGTAFVGAATAAAAISVLSAMYVAYLRVGANFERHYASDALAAVVLLGLWLFAVNAVLLMAYRAVRRSTPRRSGVRVE